MENQVAFIVPMNKDTITIDYNIRFMITDNTLHPKTYDATKVMDTFPLGNVKVVLKQDHYNVHTDLCGTDFDFFGDDNIHMVCNYRKSTLPGIKPIEPEDGLNHPNEYHTKWHLSGANDKLYINGQSQTIKAVPDIDVYENTCEWHIFIDNEDYIDKLDELDGYFDILIDEENNTITIKAINKVMANYIVKVAIYDEIRSYHDFVEMEVCI